jgi:biopolymer transport protein ExbB
LTLALLPTAAAAQTDSLTKAYQKEYAFLEAEKRALSKRLEEIERESQSKVNAARGEVEQLQRRLVGLRGQADNLELDLASLDREYEGTDERTDLLEETLSRAGDTLRRFGYDLAPPSEDPEVLATQIENLFAKAGEAITRGGQLRTEEGEFFLADGTKTSGRILRVGQVAAYGVAENGGGALAPVGGQRLKVWHASFETTARDLAAGQRPTMLELFLFETLDKAVEEKKAKTPLEVIESGGIIAWVIVCLGGLALLMILARLFILLRASSRTDKLLGRLSTLIEQGRNADALDACKAAQGAAARVLKATVRNLHRDREQIEDIVSEAILHETPTVERFGTTILVIAAVAPLLGLLGTVTGMISTFDVITEFGTGDPKMLSGGISEALVTTELGLIVAIPTLLIGTLLSGGANSILEGMERAALQVMNRADQARGNTETAPGTEPEDDPEPDPDDADSQPDPAGAAEVPA